MLAFHFGSRPESRLFHGRICVLGGSTDLEEVAPGVFQGDLSGIAAVEVPRLLRPYTFPPLELALESDWDRKISRLAETACDRAHHAGQRRAELDARVLRSGCSSGPARHGSREVWPHLELIVHGGVKFDPYRESFRSLAWLRRIAFQEVYPSSEGFIAFGDPATGLLRLAFDHGIFYEFIPVEELDSPQPARHWLATALTGVNYAIVVSTCAGMWAHLIGDTVRFESLDPPLLTFTGRTRYCALRLWRAFDQRGGRGGDRACPGPDAVAVLRDWHIGPVFSSGRMGHHLLVVEFDTEPADPARFRDAIDRDLSRRNADYRAHRTGGAGLPAPALCRRRAPAASRHGCARRGKLGGQNKVPRMDSTGAHHPAISSIFCERTGSVDSVRSCPRMTPAGSGLTTHVLKQAGPLAFHQRRDLADRVEVLDPASYASTRMSKCSSRNTTSFSVLIESRMPPVISGVRSVSSAGSSPGRNSRKMKCWTTLAISSMMASSRSFTPESF